MVTANNVVTDEKKNACAIRLMRTMLIHYAEKHEMNFDDVMQLFTSSSAYDILFDFETDVWKEGPDYLMMLFEESLERDEKEN